MSFKRHQEREILEKRIRSKDLREIELSYQVLEWRRRRDSNPRYAFRAYNGLANRRLQPLGHVSNADGYAQD